MYSLWSHSNETSFPTKRKIVKDNQTHDIKGTISAWKVIKIQFNFALWFIDWMPNHAHRQKHFAGRFRLLPQPNGALQNYSILQPDYRSVIVLDTKFTVGILRTYSYSICVEKNGQHTILCFKETFHHSNVKNKWIKVRMLFLYTLPSSPQLIEYHFWDLLM